MPRLLVPTTDALSISAAATDLLIQRGHGDAALLYLYILRHDGYFDRAECLKATHWTTLQLDTALLHLNELQLAGEEHPGQAEAQTQLRTAPDKEHAPEYSTADLTEALEQTDSEFAQLVHLVESALGKTLGTRELRSLMEMVDYLALPADVILTLIHWLISQEEQKYGAGRRPTVTVIKNKAYYWKKAGIDTMDAADAFLKKQELQQTRSGELLAACHILGRTPTNGEQEFLDNWIAWGFPPETVAYAYDITVTNKHEFRWAYCNKILLNWHNKNLHTLAEAQSEKTTFRRRPAKSKTAKTPAAPAPQTTPKLTPEEELKLAAQMEAEMEAMMRKMQGNS